VTATPHATRVYVYSKLGRLCTCVLA